MWLLFVATVATLAAAVLAAAVVMLALAAAMAAALADDAPTKWLDGIAVEWALAAAAVVR